MSTLSEAFATAIQHQRGGRPQAAEQIYRQILAVELNQPEAHYNLGNVLKDQGKLAEAVVCWRRALELKPDHVEACYNLGIALKRQGSLDDAVACFRRAVELKPDYAEAHNNLGNTLKSLGNLPQAVACYRRAVALKPDLALAHSNLGVALTEQGKLDEAIACYRRTVALKPDSAEAHGNLGAALKEQGKLDEAIASYRRAVELNPDHAEAHNNLGVAFKEQSRLDEAIACYGRALELKPDFADAHGNLGNARAAQRRTDEALACYRRALELNPDVAATHNNLGVALKEQGKLEEALGCYRKAVELKPDYAEAHSNLGVALKEQGLLDEAVCACRRALELAPDFALAHSNLLFTLQYCSEITPTALFEAHADYDRRLYVRPTMSTWCPSLTDVPRALAPHLPLRLGFVSPDFGRHPVGYFLIRVLENLCPKQSATVCYSDRLFKDDLTDRLRSAATEWRDVAGTSDERLAEQIRADRIDILFDLAGHTAHNRLLVFARKPAPIQITWAGYVGTTGLQAMDYLLADRHEVPPGAEQHYREQVLRMPDGYVCYDPPAYAPPVAGLPALNRGYMTFGCFNNPAKITPRVIEVWARILHRLPAARLVLKFKGWNDRGVARRFTELFAAQGIDPKRIELLGYSPHAQLLAEYQRVDLALDPFPYSGGLSTCEALWMGVPVLTCPGATFAGRHSLSHLSTVGLTETIAGDLDEYVERAVSLASDLPRLAELRAGLRPQMAASPLCDGKRFATHFASLLADVWKRRIENAHHL